MAAKTFRLDKQNAKWLGVCAGIADYTGIDATFVRIGAVAATLLGGFPWTLAAYVVAAFLAKPRLSAEKRPATLSTYALREAPDETERRIAEIDSFATSNHRLAAEIEQLR